MACPMIKTSKNRSPLKFFKEEDRLYMKSPTREPHCPEGVFQIQSPICCVNFSNNIAITQVWFNERKTSLTRPWKPLNHYLSPFTSSDHQSPCKTSRNKFFQKVLFPHVTLFYEKSSLILCRVGGEEILCFLFKSFPNSRI